MYTILQKFLLLSAIVCVLVSSESVQAQVIGDVNQNGMRDPEDMDLICNAVGSKCAVGPPGVFDRRDLDQDHCITNNDVDLFRLYYGVGDLGGIRAVLPGDANLDGYVDGQDFLIWSAHKFTSPTTWSTGDFNCDHTTDGIDFLYLNFFLFMDIYE